MIGALPKSASLSDLLDATWPAADFRDLGPFRLREGRGGGKRVSAASLIAGHAWSESDILAAEAAMSDPLFMVQDQGLDQALCARGYGLIDPVHIYSAPIGDLIGDLPALTGIAHWPPLAVAEEIWAEGGIGPARLQVMARVRGAKAAFLARLKDRPSGAAFVAIRGQEAMLHALEIRAFARRQGQGRSLLRACANWAAENGALRLSLAVTCENQAACRLYAGAGMQVTGQYHYRALAC